MKYIASCSFGKDSLATIILAHENGEPLDEIVFSEVMFDKETSGENPLHIDFIYNKAKPFLENWGYKVTILRGKKNYLDCFYAVCGERSKKERIGKLRGFPIAFKCKINSECKVAPIKKYIKNLGDVVQYVGIAVDEPERLKRLEGTNKVSLLEKYGYTEKMARVLCEKYGLLSPVYEISSRHRCLFCPNARERESVYIKKEHPALWSKLEELSKRPNLVTYNFNRTETFQQLDTRLSCRIEETEKQYSFFSLI